MWTPRIAVSGALVALVSLVLTACGGDGPALDRNEFLRRANAECATLKTASEDFEKAQEPNATGDEVARYMRRAADRLRRLVRRVDALVPPDDMEENVDALLGRLADYADGLDELADRARSNQTFQDVLQANSRIVDRLNTVADEVATLVATIPLVSCVLPA